MKDTQYENDPKAAALATLTDTLRREKVKDLPVNLDDLVELLDADDLRNIVGMVRPKGQPGLDSK